MCDMCQICLSWHQIWARSRPISDQDQKFSLTKTSITWFENDKEDDEENARFRCQKTIISSNSSKTLESKDKYETYLLQLQNRWKRELKMIDLHSISIEFLLRNTFEIVSFTERIAVLIVVLVDIVRLRLVDLERLMMINVVVWFNSSSK